MDALPESLFRAYDIRGIYEDTLTLGNAERIGEAIGSSALAEQATPVAVGRDGRLSGEPLLEALVRGLCNAGCDVIELGVIPTPVLYFATHYLEGVNSGVMVTGSHNPPEYNGFKIVINGTTLSGDAIQALKHEAREGSARPGGGQRTDMDVLAAYRAAVCERHEGVHPVKVVVDCGNGVAGVTVPEVLESLGHEVIRLYTEVDGTFPNHHPDPGDPDNLQDLIGTVEHRDADLGLAFDGDGDRLGVVLRDGRVVYPDTLLMALAEDLLDRHPGARVIFDVKCTGGLADVIKAAGGQPEMWRTGHSYIKARMKETGALLAGEMSGHIFMGEDWFGFDDALVAAVRLLALLGRQAMTPEAFFDRFPALSSTPEIQIGVTEETKFPIIDYLQNKVDWGDGERNTMDGIRVDYADGWGLCRASNTSPKLVTRYEGRDRESLERIRSRFEGAIEQATREVASGREGS